MKLPDPVPISVAAVRAIGERHGFAVDAHRELPRTGIINIIYEIGNGLILRVPRNHPAHIDQTRREAVAAPIARSLGVRTPELLVYDDSLAVLPVPYTIYERVPGETLGLLPLEPTDVPEVWRELGRDLALLHEGSIQDSAVGQLQPAKPLPDPRHRAEELAAQGYFSTSEARWLIGWLDELAPLALSPVPSRLLHGDTQATNIMVEPGSRRYLALLDWGNAAWGDVAIEGIGMPLRAVPFMLQGHREVAPFDGEDTIEARILWLQLQWALLIIPRQPDPLLAPAERPITTLLEIFRFLLSNPGTPWGELSPSRV